MFGVSTIFFFLLQQITITNKFKVFTQQGNIKFKSYNKEFLEML